MGSIVWDQKVSLFLEKEAIGTVENSDQLKGFYSSYFPVPKKDGRFRSIRNLRELNRFKKVLRFRMLRKADIIQVNSKGD